MQFPLTFAIFGTLVAAQPAIHKRHPGDAHAHNALHKRAIVWETVTDIVTEIIDITSTVWVDEGYTTSEAAATSTSVEASPTTFSVSTQPAQFYASPSSASTAVVPVTTSSTPIDQAAASTPSSTSVAPVATTSTAEAVDMSTEAAAVVQPTTTSTTSAAAAAATSSSSSSSSYTGTCSESSPCDGSITYYDTDGTGACGWTNDGTTEHVVALPYGLMGTASNNNPYCGMTITVKVGSKTTTAKVVDKCMGCVNYHIDLSHAAFDALADESVGVTDAEWWFN